MGSDAMRTKEDTAIALKSIASRIADALTAMGHERVEIVGGGSAAGQSLYVRSRAVIGRRYYAHDIRISDHACGLQRMGEHTAHFSVDDSDKRIAAWIDREAKRFTAWKAADAA